MTCNCCFGRCCIVEWDNSVWCMVTTKDQCVGGKSRIWTAGEVCAGGCPTYGICCGGLSCRDEWQTNCNGPNDVWKGRNISCQSPNPCDGGCCCFSDGTYGYTTQPYCISMGGSWQGRSNLGDCQSQCPKGACCESPTVCTQRTQAECLAIGGTFRGAGVSCASARCDCPSTPQLPITVYRTGGLPVPGNCTPVAVGTITTTSGSVTVTGGFSSTYSSIETQAVDACGRCVYSANNAVSGGGTASITVTYAVCAVGYPFQNTTPWCNNPMCNPLR